MHKSIVSADENASLADLADLMLKNAIKRVLILREGKLIGIVSRVDVVRAVVENLENLLEPTD
jgi:CBS domain-containing protein